MDGILLMAYGTPSTLEDVDAYYTDICGGIRPTEERIDNLKSKYLAIGGTSPLYQITEKQAAKLERALSGKAKVYFGMKHSYPFIKDAVKKASKDGVTRLLCIALAPHNSVTGLGSYFKGVEDANNNLNEKLEIIFIHSWNLSDALISCWSENIRNTVNPKNTFMIFSAHSLPEGAESNGVYKKELLETANAIAEKLGINHWELAFQSQSSRGEKWYGPTIKETISSGFTDWEEISIAPIGFISDNLEILYDIDIECKNWAKEKSIYLKRISMPNDSSLLIEALRDLVEEYLLK